MLSPTRLPHPCVCVASQEAPAHIRIEGLDGIARPSPPSFGTTLHQEALRQAGGGLGALPDQPEQFALSFLPFERRTLRRDGLHLFNIRDWDSVLPVIVKPGESVLVRHDRKRSANPILALPPVVC